MRFYRKQWQADELGGMLNGAPTRPRVSRLRQFHYDLRTEGNTPGRHALAVGVGLFIGCTPFYGLHLALSYVAARLLRVSRITVYLAANISNPFLLPLLVLAEVQAGAWILRGRMHALSVATIRTLDPWSFGRDLLVGALAVGTLLGALGMALTYAALRRRRRPDAFGALTDAAADRYLASGITGWEFARGKLRGDPVYRDALLGGVLPPGETLIDFGCGQGLMLALLIEAEAAREAGRWPATLPSPPRFRTLIGVEPRPNVVRLARAATAGHADIQAVDGRVFAFPPCSAVLFFDVLQMMPPADQEQLLRRAAASLAPGGVLLIREADAAAGERFLRVRLGNRLKALVTGAWRQPLCYRRADEWLALFARLGLVAEPVASSARGHFGNVLFRVSRPAA